MIKIKNLSKWYGSKLAVDNVSFSVEKGQVLGFIGPNGAGKSTTMRMITGFIPCSEGSVKIGEFDIQDQPIAAKELIGYLPENAPLYPGMTVAGFIGFCAESRGIYGAAKRTAVDKAIKTCFLEPVRHQNVDTLSKGYRHRTCFAQAIVHEPEILVLDEPTDGLDPNQKEEVRDLIRHIGKEKIVILSTHILEEVEAVCNRIVTIDRGKVIFDGTPDEFRLKGKDAGTLIVGTDSIMVEEMKHALEKLVEVKSVEILNKDGAYGRFRVQPEHGFENEVAGAISRLALVEKWILTELSFEAGNLVEIFRHITHTDGEGGDNA